MIAGERNISPDVQLECARLLTERAKMLRKLATKVKR